MHLEILVSTFYFFKMSNKHSETQAEKNLENIGEALSSSEQFIERNQKTILYGLLAVVVVVAAVLAYQYLYMKPKNQKAEAAIYKGERYFQDGQDSLALFGNQNDYIGFEAIIKEYKGTKTADLARAYAGISYSRLGDNEKALKYLEDFKGGDLLITPAIKGAIGDVYMNMSKADKAVDYFVDAAKKADDEMLSPIFYKKAGVAYMSAQKYDKAIEIFEKIKETYINSPEAVEAVKYIESARLLKGNK